MAGLLQKLAYFNRDDDRNNYVKTNLASIGTLSIDNDNNELVKCLSKFYRDDERNIFVKYIKNNIIEMNGEQLLSCFKVFHRDDERNIFVDTMINKIVSNLDFQQFIACLKNYSRDDDRDIFFAMIYSKVAITIDNIEEVLSSFTCGTQKLPELITEKKISFVSTSEYKSSRSSRPSLFCISLKEKEAPSEQKKLQLDTFMKSMKNYDDSNKHQLLQCMYEHLEPNKIEGICEYFKDLNILKEVFILFKIKPSIYEEYLKKYNEAMNDFWIYRYTHVYEKDGSSYDNFLGKKIDISKGINYNNTDENGRIVITGSNNSYSIKFDSSNFGSGSMNMDIRKKKIYMKNGQARIYDADNKLLITLCSRGEW